MKEQLWTAASKEIDVVKSPEFDFVDNMLGGGREEIFAEKIFQFSIPK